MPAVKDDRILESQIMKKKKQDMVFKDTVLYAPVSKLLCSNFEQMVFREASEMKISLPGSAPDTPEDYGSAYHGKRE